jgi:hypothetical protein
VVNVTPELIREFVGPSSDRKPSPPIVPAAWAEPAVMISNAAANMVSFFKGVLLD